MHIRVIREPSELKTTLGIMLINDRFFHWTLEDEIREIPGQPVESWKVPGETAIPSGLYTLDIDYSPKFQRQLIHVLDVPGFAGIRIHPLNTADETEGCIGVGAQRAGVSIRQSREAYNELHALVTGALAGGERVQLKVENPLSWSA